jgi:hypothetical protein
LNGRAALVSDQLSDGVEMPNTKKSRRVLLDISRALPFFLALVVGPPVLGVPALEVIE